MSKVNLVPAELRLDRAVFGRVPEATEQVADVGHYFCPHCRAAAEFRTRHFEQHLACANTNLSEPWNERFVAARPLHAEEWESFLDFECPGCRAPVRIIYRAGPEWAMGCHGWHLVDVVEASEWVDLRYLVERDAN
jgi:hypothetical protein